jgi:outer membrane protein TolC
MSSPLLLSVVLSPWFFAAEQEPLPAPRPLAPVPIESPEILAATFEPIDLASALRLAGVQNPQILLAQQRVAEARALRLAAVAQLLPTINTGTNLDAHNGPLQQSNGTILKVNRDALYGGLGAGAIAAGSVNIPGIVLAGNLSDTLFGALASRRVVRAREAGAAAVRNRILLDVASAYVDLLRAEGERAITLKTREETRRVAEITAAFADKGQGSLPDADRAATTLQERNVDVLQADNAILSASARLTELLGLDPSVRLHAIDGWVVPTPIVPDDVPLEKLIAIALTRRPELAEQRALIEAALLRLRQAQLLPFAPNFIAGYSAGQFGGGSNLVSQGIPQANGTILQQHRFDNFGGRQDVDVIVYWSLRNLGVGNLALNRVARANLGAENYRLAEVINRVRTEVATAYARVHARFAQIPVGERAVRISTRGYEKDFERTFNKIGLPIEVLDNLRLLYRSRNTYLAAILEYNRAQFELYVALGQPPAPFFAQPIPEKLVPAPVPPPPPLPGNMLPPAPCLPISAQQPTSGRSEANRGP